MSRAFQPALLCATLLLLCGIRHLHLQAAAEPTAGAVRAQFHVPTNQSSGKSESILTPPSASRRATLEKYCFSCHNDKLRVAGLTLDKLNHADLGADASSWERVVQQLRTGAMPPAGRPRPDQATYDALASDLEVDLDRIASLHPNPGTISPFRRLTRTEYTNAIRDLLSLENLPRSLDLNLLLPADNASSGFDNIAELLFVSSTQLEQYLSTARKLSRLAVGDATTPPLVDIYRMSNQSNQEFQADGAPFGTRGGAVIHTYLPLDGQYRIHIELADAPREVHQLEVSVDGDRAQLFTLGDKTTSPQVVAATPAGIALPAGERAESVAESLDTVGAPIPINSVINKRFERDRQAEIRRAAVASGFDLDVAMQAGPRQVMVAFLKRTDARSEGLVQPRLRGRGQQPAVASITIRGPLDVKGVGDTPSRRKIFICAPANSQASACAKRILTTLATRAYRREVTAADLQPLLRIFNDGLTERGFDVGIQRAIERILVSPQFLFRIEHQAPKVAPITDAVRPPGDAFYVSDVELASRLSFFLWSSIPDDELLQLATNGKLRDPGVLERQVRRMLKDERSMSLVTNFAAQWLFLRDLGTKSPNPRSFPDFDLSLRNAFLTETELLLDSIFREDKSVHELLNATYTFVNERLARHYGIPGVYGTLFRRVSLAAESPRRGLLGQGSVLTLTSYANRTSPVLRGKYVLANILGAEPPPPPPNIPALTTEAKESGKTLSMREAMAQHRANPACASCHVAMDSIGFALENFDAVGRWRTVDDSGTEIDSSGSLPGGERFDGTSGLRQILLNRSQRFAHTLTEKLLAYSLGRSLEYYDAPVVRQIVRSASGDEHRFSSLIIGIVESAPFQMRRRAPEKVRASR